MVEEAANPTIAVRALEPGQVLPSDIYDGQGVLLLRSGGTVTEKLLSQLRGRGEMHVYRSPPTGGGVPRQPQDAAVQRGARPTFETAATRRLDAAAEQPAGFVSTHRKGPTLPKLAPAELDAELRRWRPQYANQVQRCAELAPQVLKGSAQAVEAASQTLAECLTSIRKDFSLSLLALDLQTAPEQYLYRHALNTATLSMIVAHYMGYNEKAVLETGLAAMLHDVGMLKLPESIRLSTGPLTDAQRMEVERHPVFTVDALDRTGAASQTVMLLAYQVHERCDRSGYPRQRHRMNIHPLARIIGLADAYTAWTSWRPHRPAATAYDCVERILKVELQQGRFDGETVRGFLDCVGVFPVGSVVTLSDATIARVLRTNPGLHTRPVVVPIDDLGDDCGLPIDLSREDDVSVRAVGEAAPV